jgi:hypothetical protein
LLATFGPDKKSILSAGTHMGMAATSVLEPMVLLYRSTGDARYLEFCHYLVRSWSEPNGPKILESLGAGQPVDKTANAKAYEMTSNLVGLCELARQTGDRDLLKPLLHAWSDIVAHQLYITGTASYGEHFFGDHDRRYLATGPIGEACVTVTWMQLNLQLLRLTGEARFGEELERSLYNHLAGSQRPDGQQWCYFTPLEGKKPYHGSTTCCLSSGPRGMALAPTLACFTTRRDNADYVGINLLETFRAKLTIAGQQVTVQQQSAFPYSGGMSLTFHPERPATFGLLVRVPAWAQGLRLKDTAVTGSVRDGWMVVAPRVWKDGDQLPMTFDLRAEIVKTDQEKPRRVTLHWGPMVLAYDVDHNPGSPAFNSLVLAAASDRPIAILQSKAGGELTFEALVRSLRGPETPPMRGAVLVPFADAGAKGGLYSVWLRAPGSTPSSVESLLAFAHESRSRDGNVAGSICDGSPESYVVTFNGSKSEEDWFAVAVDEPITVRRIVFTHGKIYHDGGWFDASAGKPRVQIRRVKDADWETVGLFDSYPATTAVNPAQLTTGQTFTLRLSEPVRAVAVRAIGRPACGDNAAQAFSSCGELEAFAAE